MEQLKYMPGDPRLVDQLVFELKSKGTFDQFRKECIAEVDTRPAYQNLKQRVENSVSTFLSRQKWNPDLNKNQLREKLRKHILDGNYLEQGLERIVDQVVNPKIASVFLPQVEDLVCNYLGIPRKKPAVDTEGDETEVNLLPKDLEAVSPGSLKSEDKNGDEMVIDEHSSSVMEVDKQKNHNIETYDMIHICDESVDKNSIPLPTDDIQLSIPIPENSPPDSDPMLEDIMLPMDQIPLPKEMPPKTQKCYFKALDLLSNEDTSSSDSSINRNMSPLTPIRNSGEDNSCDAQQGLENNDNENKYQVSSFKFSIDKKYPESSQYGVPAATNIEKKDLTQHFDTAINVQLYSESSNSNNLQIDYESDANTKVSKKTQDSKYRKEKDKKSSHKSSHNSRDKQRHSSSRDKTESKDSKPSSSRDKDKDKKRDDKKSSHQDKSRDRSEKKDTKDSKDRHKSSSSSHKTSSHNSSSKHKSSTSSQRQSSKDVKKSKSSSRDDKKEHRSSSKSHRPEKDSNSSKSSKSKDDKDKDKKDKKKVDDHYSASGRNNHGRRSTDRDSNDGNDTSSKGSNVHPPSKTADSKTENKSSSKTENKSSGRGSAGPSDKDNVNNEENITDTKPMSAIRVETHLKIPITTSPVLTLPKVVLKKPKFANNFEEAKKLMKMRKFMDDEQNRMNQEAALLLEFQANVRPSLSQVYSSIPGPELEFVCMKSPEQSEDSYDEFKSLQEEMNNFENAEIKVIVDDFESQDVLMESEIIVESKEDIVIDNNIELTDETFVQDETLVQDESLIQNESVSADDTLIQNENKYELQVKNELNTEEKNVEAKELTDYFEVTVTADDASSTDDCKSVSIEYEQLIDEDIEKKPSDKPLRYFNQQEIYNSEIELDKYRTFYEKYQISLPITQSKLLLVNCGSYHKDIFNDITKNNFEIVCYNRNGHAKAQEVKKVTNIDKEISIPEPSPISSPIFSPTKSDFSFELSSDYESKLEDMLLTTSRQQIMEIILGGAIAEGSPSKIVMPKIDICQESSIDCGLKRKIEVENDNNNDVLSVNKIRRLSESQQISSTTEGKSCTPNYSLKVSGARSKYLGKARRIGLAKPKRTVQPNSPSSDKSVENYEQNFKRSPEKINGKIKSTPRAKVQRYDTTDLYKPKLYFLSRRNHVT